MLVIDASVAVAASHSPIRLAIARLLKCRLVTLDERLLRGIERLQIAVRPREV